MITILKKTVIKENIKIIGASGFNPLTFDNANLLALYDGDLDLSNVLWADQSANGYDLTLFNLPTVQAAAINGHDAIQFDGINQYGRRNDAAMIRNQPITFYIVVNQITWNAGGSIIEAGVGSQQYIQQLFLTPNLLASGGAALHLNPKLPLNTYDIITVIFNGANGVFRLNNNAAVTGDIGANNTTGLTIASYIGISNFWNGESAYIIARTAADSTATQNLFINWLKNRFAL